MDRRKGRGWKGVLAGFLGVFFLFGLPGTGLGQHGSKAAGSGKAALQSATVEGMKVTFEAMGMDAHKKHAKGGGHGQADPSQTHTLMVTLEDTASKEMVSDAKIQFTLLGPSGEKESGRLTWSGDHYGAGFSGKKKGKWQVQLKIESGGMEREARFDYQPK